MNRSNQENPLLLASFHRAVNEYSEQLGTFAARMLSDEADWAEDVAQDALLALYRHLHEVPEAAWRPWLFRVTRNLCLDRIRRKRHKPRNFRDLADADNRDPVPADPFQLRPDVRVQEQEIQEDLAAAIEELPERFREVFLLCEGEDMSYEQVATILDIPLKTVSTRLYRARQRLLKAMDRHLQEELT